MVSQRSENQHLENQHPENQHPDNQHPDNQHLDGLQNTENSQNPEYPISSLAVLETGNNPELQDGVEDIEQADTEVRNATRSREDSLWPTPFTMDEIEKNMMGRLLENIPYSMPQICELYPGFSPKVLERAWDRMREKLQKQRHKRLSKLSE